MTEDALVWDKVEWRQGDGRYRFEVNQGGLHATLSSPHGQSLTLPMVAWEGLLDALAAARKTKTRSEKALPARAGARWTRSESDDLAAAFEAGASIRSLALSHNRTAYAIETQLSQLGLWDRLQGQAAPRPRDIPRREIPADWPPDPPHRDQR